MKFETATATLKGDRDSNQDRCDVVVAGDTLLLLLADGMGGHPRGELAAQVFIDSLSTQFRNSGQPLVATDFFTRAFEQAHADIFAAGQQQQPPVEPLTTGVACLVHDHTAHWAHVGDSRLYLLRGSRTLERTRDHSMVEEFIQNGEITEAERETHPLRNIVTRALGGRTIAAAVSLSAATPLLPGDVLVLCSDGLWSALTDDQIASLCDCERLEEAVNALAMDAMQASTPASDNITLTVYRHL